jgi:hypothetical protein
MFVGRNPDGTIYGLWSVRQWAGQEELPLTDPAIVAFLAPKPPLDLSDIDNLNTMLRALALLTRMYANQLKAGTYVTKSVADTKADFMAIFQALP